MAEIFYTSEKERQNVEAFIREQKEAFERDEMQKQIAAEREGKTYEMKEFQGVEESKALEAVRAGWKSRLDILFEKKKQREIALGIWPHKNV